MNNFCSHAVNYELPGGQKPVQLGWLTDLFGGYPVARTIHLTLTLSEREEISAFSICAASWSNKCSSPKRPTNCTPIGKPAFDQMSGRLIAGWPVMFCRP
jgi:hypothetical protein